MSKDYYVLRSGRVVYSPGHYDLAGAEAVAWEVLKQHPRSTCTIVRVVDRYANPSTKDALARGGK